MSDSPTPPEEANKPPEESSKAVNTQVNNFLVRLEPSQAQVLREINELCPGYAEKLLDASIRDLNHLHDIEKRTIVMQEQGLKLAEKSQTQTRETNYLAAFVMLVAVSCVTYLGINDKPAPAAALATSLAGVVWAVRGKGEKKASDKE